MAQFRTFICLALLAACATAVLGESLTKGDTTLKSVGRTCMNRYQTILVDLYADDKPCQDAITQAWESPGKNCPSTKKGSQVHKCLSKSEASIDRWVDFIKECEVMNVAVRDEHSTTAVESESDPKPSTPSSESEGAPPGGEAGGEHAKPSCFAAWEKWTDFEAYLDGKSNGAASRTAGAVVGALLAYMGAVALL